jgi:hypothetical protein
MAAPGQETTTCEEKEGMGNDATVFAVVGGGSSNNGWSKLPKDNGG